MLSHPEAASPRHWFGMWQWWRHQEDSGRSNTNLPWRTNLGHCRPGSRLQQLVKGVWVPLAFCSKKLWPPERKYSAFDHKLLTLYSIYDRVNSSPPIPTTTPSHSVCLNFRTMVKTSAMPIPFYSEFIPQVQGKDNLVVNTLNIRSYHHWCATGNWLRYHGHSPTTGCWGTSQLYLT